MGWDLFGWSFSVIFEHKRLILLPLLSAAAALAGVALFIFAGPLSFVVHSGHAWTFRDYLWLAPAYVAVTFVVVFFNCALAACAQSIFAGQEPSIADGLNHAAARFMPILGWAVLSTTVGFILNAIEQRASWAGKIVTWIFGFAWGMATYFVVPVLIAEDCGVFGSVRRSSQLFRDTWGDQLVAGIRFGWRGLVVVLPAVILGAIGVNGYPPVLLLAVAWLVVGLAALSAAKGVFEVALYRYAALKETPSGWTPEFVTTLFPRR